MRFKISLLALSLSLVCFIPRIAFADTLDLVGVGGQSTDGIYVYPYNFDITGTGVDGTNVALSCLNFDREVTIGESWTVNAVSVSNIGSTGLDYESQQAYIEDAWLFNKYASATGATKAQQISNIQFAIWYIMDPTSAVTSESGYTTVDSPGLTSSATLDAEALAAYNSKDYSFDVNDIVFVPISANYPSERSEPQIFMENNPNILPQGQPPATPEPSSLILLGTGLIGMAGVMRRKLQTA